LTISPTTIVLIISSSFNADGQRAYSTRGKLFDGKVDGRRIVKRSAMPFCDAARALLEEGIDPDTVFVMRHHNSPADALRSSVGVAAALTVADADGGKPVFRTWKPFDAYQTGAVASPMRQNESPATLAPSDGALSDLPPRVLADLSAVQTVDAEEALLLAIEGQAPLSQV